MENKPKYVFLLLILGNDNFNISSENLHWNPLISTLFYQ